MTSVICCDAIDLIDSLDDNSVHLFLTDPPYGGIVDDKWDNEHSTVDQYVEWFSTIVMHMVPKMTDDGSLVFFGANGYHGWHPMWQLVRSLEDILTLRDVITWKKRRAYGKLTSYLYTREEIVWMSKSEGRLDVRFNIPLSDELRGYDGFNSKYKAKSPYKRITNVWTDIHELMRPRRTAEKPVALMERLVSTHSLVGDLVIDPFAGLGPTGVASLKLGRKFIGCDLDQSAVDIAERDCSAVITT